MPYESVVSDDAFGFDSGNLVSPATLSSGTRTLTITGQVGRTPDDKVVSDDVGDQARECLRQIDALLKAAGASKADVVGIRVYLTDVDDRGAVAAARAEYFGDYKPASTLVGVAALYSPEYKVEIEATAIF